MTEFSGSSQPWWVRVWLVGSKLGPEAERTRSHYLILQGLIPRRNWTSETSGTPNHTCHVFSLSACLSEFSSLVRYSKTLTIAMKNSKGISVLQQQLVSLLSWWSSQSGAKTVEPGDSKTTPGTESNELKILPGLRSRFQGLYCFMETQGKLGREGKVLNLKRKRWTRGWETTILPPCHGLFLKSVSPLDATAFFKSRCCTVSFSK